MTIQEFVVHRYPQVVRKLGHYAKGEDAYYRKIGHTLLRQAGVPYQAITGITGWSVFTIFNDQREVKQNRNMVESVEGLRYAFKEEMERANSQDEGQAVGNTSTTG